MNEKNRKKIQYAAAIREQLADMMENEECSNYLDDWKENLTEFFTAIHMAVTTIFNDLTGEKKNFLEFDHIVNQLIVQHMLDTREDKNKKQEQE